MIFRKYLFLFSITALMFSCNKSDIGVFYGLSIEEKIIDRSLPNNLTIGGIVKNNSTLYIAAGRVYRKTSGSTMDWIKMSSPSGYDLSTQIASAGTNIYAIFYNKTTADSALFSMMTNTTSWNEVSGPFTGKVNMVNAVNNVVFVSTYISGSDPGYIYYSDNGTVYTDTTIKAGGGHFDVDYDSVNDDYWILTGTAIYKIDAAFAITDTIEQSTPGIALASNHRFRYIFIDDDNGNIFVTRSDRKISAFSDSGSSWATGSSVNWNLNNLNKFTYNGAQYILCGTDGRGYMEMTPPSPQSPNLSIPQSMSVLSDNYSSATVLQRAVVRDIFIDGNEFYALTVTDGLWKNSVIGGLRIWSIE